LNWQRGQPEAESTIFRDYIHANPYFLSAAGEKMLRNRFSRYFIERPQHRCPKRLPLPMPPWIGSPSGLASSPARVQVVHLVASASNETFYYASIRHARRWANASRGFQAQLHLGLADVFSLPDEVLSTIPLAGTISAPELWDEDRQGYLQTTPNGIVVLLEKAMMSLDSWPSVFKTMRCKTLLSNSSTAPLCNGALQSIEEDLVALLPSCPSNNQDRVFPPLSK